MKLRHTKRLSTFCLAIVVVLSICSSVFAISSTEHDEEKAVPTEAIDTEMPEVIPVPVTEEVLDDTVENTESFTNQESGEAVVLDSVAWDCIADKLNRVNPELLRNAANELAKLPPEQIDQVVTVWTQNIFALTGPDQTIEAYCSNLGLSKETSLVLLLANLDMGMRYITEHFDGKDCYIQEFTAAYENIYAELEAVDESSLCEDDYINALCNAFTAGFIPMIQVNWAEQEEEAQPKIVQWGYAYFERQCYEDVDICLTMLTSMADAY